MMRISRGCEYAIAIMVRMARQHADLPLHAEAIAEGASIPRQFARNICAQLASAGLLRAHRGAVRGYSLARSPSEISLHDIIEAYDGPLTKPWCFADRDQACNAEDPCFLHDLWLSMRDSAREILMRATLDKLAQSPRRGFVAGGVAGIPIEPSPRKRK